MPESNTKWVSTLFFGTVIFGMTMYYAERIAIRKHEEAMKIDHYREAAERDFTNQRVLRSAREEGPRCIDVSEFALEP